MGWRVNRREGSGARVMWHAIRLDIRPSKTKTTTDVIAFRGAVLSSLTSGSSLIEKQGPVTSPRVSAHGHFRLLPGNTHAIATFLIGGGCDGNRESTFGQSTGLSAEITVPGSRRRICAIQGGESRLAGPCTGNSRVSGGSNDTFCSRLQVDVSSAGLGEFLDVRIDESVVEKLFRFRIA